MWLYPSIDLTDHYPVFRRLTGLTDYWYSKQLVLTLYTVFHYGDHYSDDIIVSIVIVVYYLFIEVVVFYGDDIILAWLLLFIRPVIWPVFGIIIWLLHSSILFSIVIVDYCYCYLLFRCGNYSLLWHLLLLLHYSILIPSDQSNVIVLLLIFGICCGIPDCYSDIIHYWTILTDPWLVFWLIYQYWPSTFHFDIDAYIVTLHSRWPSIILILDCICYYYYWGLIVILVMVAIAMTMMWWWDIVIVLLMMTWWPETIISDLQLILTGNITYCCDQLLTVLIPTSHGDWTWLLGHYRLLVTNGYSSSKGPSGWGGVIRTYWRECFQWLMTVWLYCVFWRW